MNRDEMKKMNIVNVNFHLKIKAEEIKFNSNHIIVQNLHNPRFYVKIFLAYGSLINNDKV